MIKCKHPYGIQCSANVKGECIALESSNFKRPCPFFRSIAEMKVAEWLRYKKEYRGERGGTVFGDS